MRISLIRTSGGFYEVSANTRAKCTGMHHNTRRILYICGITVTAVLNLLPCRRKSLNWDAFNWDAFNR